MIPNLKFFLVNLIHAPICGKVLINVNELILALTIDPIVIRIEV